MDETPHRSAYRVMITIDTVYLPDDPDQRQDVHHELRDQVRELLDDHPQAHAVDVKALGIRAAIF